MRQPQVIAEEMSQVKTITSISSIFETIASMRIAEIKQQVLTSKDFFSELWALYSALRTDPLHSRSSFGLNVTENKELFLVITAEGGFSGDIDQKLIEWMVKSYDENKHDIIVIGHHGVVQLAQRGIKIKRYFKLPEEDQDINVNRILREIMKYPNTTAFYQTYVSLSVQDVKRIPLQSAVQNLSKDVKEEDVISVDNYIFEPSADSVIEHLESTMLSVAVAQVILESKLAQYASRFKAMSAAHDKSQETYTDLRLSYNRSKRALADERSKEIINAMRLSEGMA